MKKNEITLAIHKMIITSSVISSFSLMANVIIPDKNVPIADRPILSESGSGVPVVNITNPSAQGVSRNQFTDFNVNAQGVILNNNASSEYSHAVNGERIQKNHLLRKEANIILNEVTGSNSSNLTGQLEIVGGEADIILANPNGVTCDGCKFINTNRTTLTTGRVDINNGGINTILLKDDSGIITINGQGLKGGNVDIVDIISGEILIDANLESKEKLRLISSTGVDVDYETLELNNVSSRKNREGIKVNISSLGSMYSNSIYILSNDTGSGVYSKGHIASLKNDVIIDSNGDVIFGSDSVTTAKNDVSINSGSDIILNDSDAGFILSESGNIQLNSESNIDINKNLFAEENIDIKAREITIDSAVVSGNDITLGASQVTAEAGSVIESNGTLNLEDNNTSGSSYVLEGTTILANEINADIDGVQLDDKTSLLGRDNVNLTIDEITNRGDILSGGSIEITSNHLHNINTDSSSAGNISTLNENGDLTIESEILVNSGIIHSEGRLTLNDSNRVTNQSDGALTSVNKLALNDIENLENTGLILSTSGEIEIKSNNFINNGSVTTLDSDLGNVKIESESIVNNELLISSGAFSIDSERLENHSSIISGNDLNIVSDVVNNQGDILSEGKVFIDSHSLSNLSFIRARNDLSIKNTSGTTSQWDFSDGSALVSFDGLLKILLSDNLINNGILYSGHDIALLADLDNENSLFTITNEQSGSIEAGNSISLGYDCTSVLFNDCFYNGSKTTEVVNKGVIKSGNEINIVADAFHNLSAFEINRSSRIEMSEVYSVQWGLLSFLREGRRDVTEYDEFEYFEQSEIVSDGAINVKANNIYNNGLISTSGVLNVSSLRNDIDSKFVNQSINLNATSRIDVYRDGLGIGSTAFGILGGRWHNGDAGVNNYVYSSKGGVIESREFNLLDGKFDFTNRGINSRFEDSSHWNDELNTAFQGRLDAERRRDEAQSELNSLATQHTGSGHDQGHDIASDNIIESNSVGADLAVNRVSDLVEDVNIAEDFQSGLSDIINELDTLLTTETTSLVNIDNIQDFGDGDIFELVRDENALIVNSIDESSNYLYQFNSKFRDTNYQSPFSDPLELLHLPSNTIRFGSAEVELRYINDQIKAKIGRERLNLGKTFLNSHQQTETLVANGLSLLSSSGYQFGAPLPIEALNNLESDIVWYEYQNVNGVIALVPKVYLTEETLNRSSGGLISTENFNIYANSFNNFGGTLEASSGINLISNHDVNNISGTIKANNVSIQSLLGKFNNISNLERHNILDSTIDTRRSYQDLVFNSSVIAEDTIDINGQSGVNNIGASIVAGSDVNINAKNGDLNFISFAKELYTEKHSNSWTASAISFRFEKNKLQSSVDSLISAEGNISLKADAGNILSRGAQFSSDDLTMDGDNVYLTALTLDSEESLWSMQASIGGNWGFTGYSNIEEMSQGVGNTIQTKDLKIGAKDNILLEGGTFTTDSLSASAKNIDIVATKNVFTKEESNFSLGYHGSGRATLAAHTASFSYNSAGVNFNDNGDFIGFGGQFNAFAGYEENLYQEKKFQGKYNRGRYLEDGLTFVKSGTGFEYTKTFYGKTFHENAIFNISDSLSLDSRD